MSKLLVVAGLLLIFGCKQQETRPLLQIENVQLVKPRVMATNQVIDSSVILTAELRMDAVKIYMTEDGSEPSESSKLYTKPLKITQPGTYKFKAFHPAWKASETEVISLIKKGKSVDTIMWLTKANSKYKGKGARTLINHAKARVNFTDPEWVGFDTIASAITQFKEKTYVKSLDIGYLNNPGAWIFPPEQIDVLVSANGVDFMEKETLNIEPLTKGGDQVVETVRLPINETVKAIKVEVKNVKEIPSWHDGAGNKAWLFMDEWIFN